VFCSKFVIFGNEEERNTRKLCTLQEILIYELVRYKILNKIAEQLLKMLN